MFSDCACVMFVRRDEKKKKNEKKRKTQKQTRFKCKAQSALIRTSGNIPASELARVARA